MTKNLDYIELICEISPYSEEHSDILIAYLNDIGFEGYLQTETGLNAYIPERNCSEAILKTLKQHFQEFKVTYLLHTVKDQNWNEVWTRNYFEPIVFGNDLVVRASFHTDYPKTDMEITIDPKTAFGTGNHGTTFMLMEEILKMDIKDKSVLDMGTGTGILAILSNMKGSAYTLAVDNDPKAVINTCENIEVNNTPDIQVEEGDIKILKQECFDIIYENIWKNIVINDIPILFKHLNSGGTLLVSGFYYKEYEEVKRAGELAGLTFVYAKEKNEWAMLKFLKL
jgi:ribosomal protein L11 methyltransferase